MKILRITPLIGDKALSKGVSESQIIIEMAQVLGVKPRSIALLKNTTNPRQIRADQLVVMANYFHVTLEDLINPQYLNQRKE